MQNTPYIAMVGNPNSGKTSLFNLLTGLSQKVGNFPGVTVDKKMGYCQLGASIKACFIDLPGTYSLYPRRSDEWIGYNVILKQDKELIPSLVLLVADAANLKRNLLFCTQIIDLKIPVVMVLTMMDRAVAQSILIDVPLLERQLGVPIVVVNPIKKTGIATLKKTMLNVLQMPYTAPTKDFVDVAILDESVKPMLHQVKQLYPLLSNYEALHYLFHFKNFKLPPAHQQAFERWTAQTHFKPTLLQGNDILHRYKLIKTITQQSVVERSPLEKKKLTEKIDKILLHKKWSYFFLAIVLFALFQSVFTIAQYPMRLTEQAFGYINTLLVQLLPQHWLTNLLTEGILAGLSGIFVFVPQIMILFGLITLLENTGYMARISFLTDRLMRRVGLNGKSVMPMISGFACAVPAIMSTRGIVNRKERLLTILVTPLMSCSARLPVFTVIIGLAIPPVYLFGFLSLQGIVMFSLYILGTLTALIVSYIGKWFIKSNEKSFFILELPAYQKPNWRSVGLTMIEKGRGFITDAGRVILVVSICLWFLCNFGPTDPIKNIAITHNAANNSIEDSTNRSITTHLQNSYAGLLGKKIEPIIRPLGFDWRIGIALITSFAAREVFVGTMATLYSVEGGDNIHEPLRKKMELSKHTDGTKVYTLATGISLMLFYLFAMQCVSTLAVVKKETNSWKWPLIQFLYMTGLAYTVSLLVYQFFG